MNIESILSMGGYGFYVWPAYCITLIIFLFTIIFIKIEKNKIKKIIQNVILNTETDYE